ncbi:MAG TPA: protein-L-isoaspartate O-methyltransferase [Steroidobacteraceae bacterium]
MTLSDSAREQMVQQQVRAWDVLDERVLDTFRNVPRERFVPAEHRFLAFADTDIPLPHGQHMLRPNLVGRLLQSLELQGSERVLEIGTGTGFVTACLASRSAHVRSLEIFPDLADTARTTLADLRISNVEVVAADATRLETAERYDAIALTASLPIRDEQFERLLAIGGRLFAVVGEPPAMEAWLVRCMAESVYARESLFETVLDPLINARRPRTFTF